MRNLLLATTLLTMSTAQAAQITFGDSVQPVTFAREGAGLHVSAAPQVDLRAFDTTSPLLGGAWILGLDFTTGPEENGIFPAAPNSATFKYQNGPDLLIERINATFVQDHTTQPKVFGTGVTTEIAGDAAFLAAFGPMGTVDSWDFITNDIGVVLDKLQGVVSANISAGEKFTLVPEPETFGLFGTAVAALVVLRFVRPRRRVAER